MRCLLAEPARQIQRGRVPRETHWKAIARWNHGAGGELRCQPRLERK
jgi:hypothetical protein